MDKCNWIKIYDKYNPRVFLIGAIFIAVFSYTFSMNAYALIEIVAAENIYGEVAKTLGGKHVNVVSILNNPSQDPHLFTTTPSTAKAVSHAKIVVYNGADYDPWITSMLALDHKKEKSIINVASLIPIQPGQNPHIWYLPKTMPLFAHTLIKTLIQLDPENKKDYEKNFNAFNRAYQVIFTTINGLKKHYHQTPVIATEPVFNYMADSIGLKMHGEAFQINMMNNVPPTISEIKSFEEDLYHRRVKVLIYNNQVINPLTLHMKKIAEAEKIPILGVSELLPPDITYINWMMQTLTELETALKSKQFIADKP